MRACLSEGRNEVIVPAVSWISTASAAALAGAKISFCDVVEPSICIDVAKVKKLVSERTAAVIVVHLYGKVVDGLVELATWLEERGFFFFFFFLSFNCEKTAPSLRAFLKLFFFVLFFRSSFD